MTKENFNQLFDRKLWVAQDRRDTLLRDLFHVGKNKPVGFLRLSFLEKNGVSIEQTKKDLTDRGLSAVELSAEESGIPDGALYAYDRTALHELLISNEQILVEAAWPTNPDEFILHLRNSAPEKTALYNVVADAFGDKDNPRRLRENK